MAFLDTLKKGLGTAVSYATAPITAPFKAAKSSFDSTVNLAKKAASMANTSDPNKLFSSTGGANSLKNDTTFTVPTGGGVQTVTKSPTPTLQQSNPVTPKGDIGVPQTGSNSVAPKAVSVPNPIAPKPATPAPAPAPAPVNTQISGSNPFGNSNYTPTFSTPAPVNSAPLVATSVATPMAGSVNTPPPAQQPAVNPELEQLRAALLSTYQQTPEERQAQEALQRLAQQQADLSGAYRSGTNKIGEQPIVLDLLRGQKQVLQKQYEGQVGALADQAKPLEVQLANLIANRDLQNKVLTTQYGFASEEQKRQDAIDQARATGNKPIEVGGSLLQLNPQTGQYEVIYRAPSEDANGFTLSEGQIRYDANGNPIAMGGNKTTNGSAPEVKNINGVDSQYNPATGTWDPVMTSGSTPKSQSQLQTIDTLLSSVDSVLNHPGLNSRVGWQGGLPAVPGTAGADFDSRLEFMKAQFGKMGVELLKGLGAMSEGERKAMTDSFSTISRTQSEAEFKAELNRIKEVFNRQKGILSQGSQGGQITTQSLVQKGVRQDLIDQLTAMGKTPQEIAQIAGVSFNNAPSKALNGSKIGSLSAKYESGGNPGAIGYDSTGGYSYGTYQLAHNNAQSFVAESPYAQQFAGIPFNSPQFQQKWKQIAQADPQGFAQAQHDYIAKTHLEPVVNRLKAGGIDVSRMSPTVQDVIWSTAVQHGPGNKIIEQAMATAKDERDFIQKVYQLRWNNGAGFASSTPSVRQSVYNRFFGPNGELATALSRVS